MIKVNWLQEKAARQVKFASAQAAVNRFNKLKGAKYSGTINVKITSSTAIKRLNRKFAGKASATDVLSFSYREKPTPPSFELGDVVINREDIYASSSPETKFAYLAIHGVLHILGYDHATSAAKARFERLLKRLIA